MHLFLAPPMPKNLFPRRPRIIALDSSSHDPEQQNDDSDDEEGKIRR